VSTVPDVNSAKEVTIKNIKPCLPVLFISVSIIVYLSIALLSLHKPVTGYLHSWNQVTTLALIKQISQDHTSFIRPRDVVTRVTWEPSEGIQDPEDRTERFTIFEEFPLYHLLSAGVGLLINSLEGGGRLLSVFFFFAGLIGLYSLSKRSSNTETALFTITLYVTSFPFLYYGQAVMSDMAMTAAAIWGVNFLSIYVVKQERAWLFIAAASIAISGLFKSYGTVLALCFIFLFLYRRKLNLLKPPNLIHVALLMFISLSPAVSWHIFAIFQGGVQEFESHSLHGKLLYLGDPAFYSTFINIWFRYLGYLPGGILILAILLKPLKLDSLPLLFGKLPWWFYAWGISSIVYLAVTADKLIYHDYYFLLVFPPFFFFGGILLTKLFLYLDARSRVLAVSVISVVLAVNILTAQRSLLKAISVNPDVMLCAELINSQTESDEIIATLTDVSRYNSLAYYSNRLAINVEQDAFPLSRYLDAGASIMVVNLPPEEYQFFKTVFLPAEKDQVSLKEAVFPDFRGRPRTCALLRPTQPGNLSF